MFDTSVAENVRLARPDATDEQVRAALDELLAALETPEDAAVDLAGQGNLVMAMRNAGIRPADVKLELTESVLMSDSDLAVRMLNELKGMGIHTSLDDFGTGYSSLSYLKRLPIDTLKIDQSFVADLESPDGAAIVDAILALSKTLNLRSIAEGIETEEQLDQALSGLKEQCLELIGAGKKVLVQ